MDMQNRFWNRMVQIKFEILYFNEYIEQSGKFDICVNTFTAITSSGSIAGWAIWNNLKFIWAILIAMTQVITVIKSYLPYHKRVEFLSKLCFELSGLFINCEHLWYDVSNGSLTNNEINDKLRDIQIKEDKIKNKYLGSNILPLKNKLETKANIKLKEYFNKYY
ncbi:hypothetical protein [Clostridium ljungdahlii]|uniref:SMODS and SLOG-associating 2TM effector domain-containing protein n=1 Tax=Clostridium ljungdahlii TaxID=1538 RepID=A0A170NKS4_9CLOT|nr:hypothetical protein [Clostridium ljungdahlii]OAA91277.1 hypothetical protein WY13_00842 [Clostridium ljungdahlii]